MAESPWIAVGVVAPFLFIFIAATVHGPEIDKRVEEQRQQERIAADKWTSDQVQVCLEQKGPWKCFEALIEVDEDYPVKDGQPRVVRFASLSTAQEVLELCDLPRRVDCANKMFGRGYKATDVQQALKAVGEISDVIDAN